MGVTPDMGPCTQPRNYALEKKREEDLLALWQVVIFLFVLNGELCPGVTACPKLPPFTLLSARNSNTLDFVVSL